MRFQFHLLISNNLLNCWTHKKKVWNLQEKAWTQIANISICKCHFSFLFLFSFLVQCMVFLFSDGLQCFMIFKRFVAPFFPLINLKSIDLHLLYSQSLWRRTIYVYIYIYRERRRETNLEQSAAAGPFPLCRTAHASFDPENYLKSTEGHIRWKLWLCGDTFKDTIQDSKEKKRIKTPSPANSLAVKHGLFLKIQTEM